MNNLESFAALTAAILGAITALLVLLSHLEPLSDTEGSGKRWIRSGP